VRCFRRRENIRLVRFPARTAHKDQRSSERCTKPERPQDGSLILPEPLCKRR
jgi:hypothetical protein